VDYQGLVRRLNLPTGGTAPTELAYDDIPASALTQDHLGDDVQGINASLELIRRTRRVLADRAGHRGLQLCRPRLA
jgi:hypothetical protein